MCFVIRYKFTCFRFSNIDWKPFQLEQNRWYVSCLLLWVSLKRHFLSRKVNRKSCYRTAANVCSVQPHSLNTFKLSGINFHCYQLAKTPLLCKDWTTVVQYNLMASKVRCIILIYCLLLFIE